MEQDIHDLGLRLLQASEPAEPFLLTPDWWQQRVLDWATSDPRFRVKLLRFVDVLPSLRSGAAVGDHVRQYFRGDAPPLVHVGSALAGEAIFRPVLSRVVREGVYAMAHRFIAGESPEEALPRLRQLAKDGTACTVDLLGEATLSENEAAAYLDRYSRLIEALARDAPVPEGGIWQGVPAVNISIKLTALYSQFEPAAPEEVSAAILERLRPLLRLARARRAFVNVDMEQNRYRDGVHAAFANALLDPEFRDFTDVGIVVQAYLKDAPDDIARLRRLAERDRKSVV